MVIDGAGLAAHAGEWDKASLGAGVLSSGLCSVPTGDTPTQPKPS